MKMLKINKRKIRIASAIMAASFTVFTFQNCGGKNSGSDLSSLETTEAGETSVPVIKVEKVDQILHSRSVANALVQGLGVSNGANVDAINDLALSTQMLFSEKGEYDSITGGLITIHAGVAEKACQDLIWDEERDKLKIELNQIIDKRRIFRGIHISEAAVVSPFNSKGEIESGADYANYTNKTRYREAIKRLAKSLWRRDSTKAEEDALLAAIDPVLSAPENNRAYRASVMICTMMASSFDFIRL